MYTASRMIRIREGFFFLVFEKDRSGYFWKICEGEELNFE